VQENASGVLHGLSLTVFYSFNTRTWRRQRMDESEEWIPSGREKIWLCIRFIGSSVPTEVRVNNEESLNFKFLIFLEDAGSAIDVTNQGIDQLRWLLAMRATTLDDLSEPDDVQGCCTSSPVYSHLNSTLLNSLSLISQSPKDPPIPTTLSKPHASLLSQAKKI
jgi:hypothetical protein